MNIDDLVSGASFEDMSDFDALLDAAAFVRGLPEREQKILMLFCEGYTQEEVGARMGCNHSTVSRVLAKVHKKAQKWRVNYRGENI